MKFNSYNLTARVFPALLSAISFFTLNYYYLRPRLGEFWNELLGMQVVGDVTLSLVFLFLLIHASRFISKELFEKKIFGDGINFPTVEFLLHLDSYFSPEYTKKIHEKVATDFNISIPSIEEETQDQNRSRKLIAEALHLVRAKVKEGRLVDQHNSEYGFFRNLAGGAVIGLIISLVNLGIFWKFNIGNNPFWIAVISLIVYLAILLFSKKLIIFAGRNYAKVLIQEYMAQ